MERTLNEHGQIRGIAERLQRLRAFLNEDDRPTVESSAAAWLDCLRELKAIQGHLNNAVSFAACLTAKEYLTRRLPMVPFELKAQGAKGFDIDERTFDGQRVIAEIKTNDTNEFGRFYGEQISSLGRDLVKLQQAEAAYRFFFVTNEATLAFVQSAFPTSLDGIQVVCLTEADE